MIKMIIKARRTYLESASEFLRVQNVGQLRESIRTCLVVLAAEDDPDKVSKGGEQNLIRSNSSRQILIIINKKFRWIDRLQLNKIDFHDLTLCSGLSPPDIGLYRRKTSREWPMIRSRCGLGRHYPPLFGSFCWAIASSTENDLKKKIIEF